MNEFKAGDLVYCPTLGDSAVYEVGCAVAGDEYALRIYDIHEDFTSSGRYFAEKGYSTIFHATKENQALLEALYGVKFDDPPLSDKEKVIEALKNANGKPVLCWVSNDECDWCIRAIGKFDLIHGFQLVGGCYGWEYAKPLSPDEFVLA